MGNRHRTNHLQKESPDMGIESLEQFPKHPDCFLNLQKESPDMGIESSRLEGGRLLPALACKKSPQTWGWKGRE